MNSNWRGGRTRHKRGYLHDQDMLEDVATVACPRMLWCPDHHEEMLGRLLLPGENVHHRNGVKDDNRPENLELWTRPQPTGIRADEAVAWARQIIALYGDENSYTGEGSPTAA